MKYEIKYTGRFKKDFKRAEKQNKNVEKLFEVIEKIANGEKLEAKWKDHALSGNYAGTRECHIESDWLLIYEVFEDILVLSLLRTGSHSDLF